MRRKPSWLRMIRMRRFLKGGCLMKTIRMIGRLRGLKIISIKGWFSNGPVTLPSSRSNSSSILCTGSWPSEQDGISAQGRLLGSINWNGQVISLARVARPCTLLPEVVEINLCRLIQTAYTHGVLCPFSQVQIWVDGKSTNTKVVCFGNPEYMRSILATDGNGAKSSRAESRRAPIPQTTCSRSLREMNL